MNELEMLMIAESKKNAIDDELIKDEQQCEYDKACNWATETMDKLSSEHSKKSTKRLESGRNQHLKS